MVTVQDIYAYLNQLAPVSYQMDFDNSGFLVGDRTAEVNKVLLTLDITDEVIEEAAKLGVVLIVSHHPLLFHPLKHVWAEDVIGRKVIALSRHGIAAICMHTNLDIADGGVNDALMEKLDARVTGLLEPAGTDENGNPLGCGRVGELKSEMELPDFLAFAAERLKVSGIRYCDGCRPVKHLAVCGGSGGSMLELAYEKGCDTLLTADVKYDRFLAAKDLGMNLIDADHFCTENVVIPALQEKLSDAFPNVEFRISSLQQTAQFYTP